MKTWEKEPQSSGFWALSHCLGERSGRVSGDSVRDQPVRAPGPQLRRRPPVPRGPWHRSGRPHCPHPLPCSVCAFQSPFMWAKNLCLSKQ